ncbi:kinase-like domain-containing protein [Vararia minispora EC-137]|uniref:Kinase-like domain-containing protein n=1 Tax=Vararia minispora EC-137 TaxID=1314806 RepID=A0ACB8QFI7_9AGAM|nr:kinase-like domain-containing protein [Vararia minispora EC-137]
MHCLGRAAAVLNLLKIPVSLRPVTAFSLPRRTLSTVTDSQNDLFDYTSGRWVYNDALRHEERRLEFDVDGLRRIAAESINQSLDDVVSLSKLAEGGFNRSFLITLRDGRQMVARVPYPVTVPKYYAVASEVATIEYLRSCGLPTPKIYGYSPDSHNAARTAYILMEFVQGSKLSDVWRSLGDEEVISVIRQLTQLESRMMSLSFPAGGSLYFTKDLDGVASGLGVLLDDARFCVGPDTRLPLWFGRRARLDVDRGPYHSAEAALVVAARKELAYLTQFGRPILPFRRERRPSYLYQPQLPSSHIENLERYLRISSSLIPRDPALSRFCLRHPDLQHNNIIVSRSLESGCQVVGLIDWQHTSILPMFLLVGVPQRLQNYDDPVSQSMTLPSLPDNFDKLDEARRDHEEYIYRRRLVHYHYVTSMKECNQPHYAAFMDPLWALRNRLFQHAGEPWEGETINLKLALIEAMEKWKEFTGRDAMCPIEFDAEDQRQTMALDEMLGTAGMGFETLQDMAGLAEEGWVSTKGYESAVAFLKSRKDEGLAMAESAEEREEIMTQWPWDDMDEEEYR